jgi:hypothetical protein
MRGERVVKKSLRKQLEPRANPIRTNRGGQASPIVPVLIVVIALVILGGWWYLKNRQKEEPVNPQQQARLAYIETLKGTNWVTVQSGNPLLKDCAGWKPCEDRRDLIDSINKCGQKDWTKAYSDDPLWGECDGKGIESYDKRRDYIRKLRDANWQKVKADDPLLKDCAGWKACEDRVNQLAAPPPPPTTRKPVEPKERGVDWSKASCEKIKNTWEPEDHRLSNCDGLSPNACSNIKTCLGIRNPDIGPGVKN